VTTMAPMATIAWMGTGLLGSGFVEAALSRGERVRVWNRTEARARPLEEKGATLCRTPEEAAEGAERLHLCLSDDEAVDAVLARALPALPAEAPVIDHTTVSPAGAVARARRLAAQGRGFLACPVFMGPINARQATGRMLCAGPAPLIEQLAPALRAMTGELVIYDADVSRPCVVKLVGNALIIGMAGCIADAFVIGQSGGLPAADVIEFLSSFPLAGILAGRGKRMAAGDHEPSFELSMARKDVRLMLEGTGGGSLSVLPGVAARMDALIERGLGGRDLGVLAIDTVPCRS
jgi:3-hydroxyisobutyrate dehydrogenase